jgi:signal transduction histidine kinase
MMTSHASAQTAIEALRRGAYDYIHKPFELDALLAVVERALERHRLTIHNRRLVEELSRQNADLTQAVRRLNALNAAGLEMSGLTALDDLLGFVVGVAHAELGAERVSLMLLDEREELLRIAAAHGLREEVVRDTRVRLGEGVAGVVARDGRPVVASDADEILPVKPGGWPGVSGGFISMPVRISVPIRTSHDVLGVLNLANRRDGAPFTEDDAAFLASLAGQAAVAIERARQAERLRETYESLRRSEDQVASAERIRALGEMAAGVAHDFNNVLHGVLGRSQLILRELNDEPVELSRIRRWTELIEKLARQGAGTVRRIQEFTRIRRDRPTTPVVLNDAVNLAVTLTEPKWREESHSRGLDVAVEAELADVPAIAGDLQELSQAVSNLVFNSVEALPQGGRITLRTAVQDDQVTLEVRDDGVGMSHETRERLFDPFFSTKPHGEGLGMSVVYGIVHRFGGTIEVDSEPGRGTRIRLAFPALPARARATEPRPAPAASDARGEVLVVDDEPHSLEVCAEFLTSAGHTVDTAASGREALERLAGRRYDVVITDLSMPGLSGWDVARTVKRHHPGTRVMLLSGWGVQQEATDAQGLGVDLVVAKPLDMDTMLDSVQRLLAA